jgi:hypothetical protein
MKPAGDGSTDDAAVIAGLADAAPAEALLRPSMVSIAHALQAPCSGEHLLQCETVLVGAIEFTHMPMRVPYCRAFPGP